MTEAEKIEALVSYRLEAAEEALKAASGNLEHGFIRSSVNRAYYAMFYSVLALLATEKKETSKHSAVVALFDQLYVMPELLPKSLSRWLHDAFDLRQQVDYETELLPTPEEARASLDHAVSFVEQVRAKLQRPS